jgi:hypothetical protein
VLNTASAVCRKTLSNSRRLPVCSGTAAFAAREPPLRRQQGHQITHREDAALIVPIKLTNLSGAEKS